MVIQKQCFIFTLLVGLDVALGTISCTNPDPLSIRVGDEGSSSTFCVMPQGGEFSVTYAPFGYPMNFGVPIIGKSEQSMGPGLVNYTVKNTFRGFDNMLNEGQDVTKRFEFTFSNTPTGSSTESVVVNFTVQFSRSDSHEAALVPPTKITVPCLVQGVDTPVVVNFGAPNASRTYRSLISGWKSTDLHMPWVYSRPSRAISTTPTDTHRFDGSAQPILQSIEAGPHVHSLVLNMKPPGPESSYYGTSWQVCIIPGDGYNWFPEICSEDFAVRQSQEECDATTTTSSSGSNSALRSFGMWRFAMAVFLSAFSHCIS